MSIAANLRKTYYYLKKNGIGDTYYAVRERLYARTSPLYMAGYTYIPVPEEELFRQRKTEFEKNYKFSIVVPMYETNPDFAKAMIRSVLEQTYSCWELILADASKTDVVKNAVYGEKEGMTPEDSRIIYVRIGENKGISHNTNEALRHATGDYVGLLDHDDLLTPDALYEMAVALETANKEGKEAAFVYSDEDKCDTEAKKFYEPHIKSGFNRDLLFSNNYICHFLVMKRELIQKLGFRNEYDGAQDFDLVLRASLEKHPEDVIMHVNKVLYHWRCHDLSTAANPQSKLYAYEAGKRAVEEAIKRYLIRMHGEDKVCEAMDTEGEKVLYVNQIPVKVVHTKHNGFYRVQYGKGSAKEIFAVRKDIGVVAGPVIGNKKITSGILDEDGMCEYAGMPAGFSGYIHKMALQQNCKCVDLRNAAIRNRLADAVGINTDNMKKINQDLIEKSGYIILFDPQFRIQATDKNE